MTLVNYPRAKARGLSSRLMVKTLCGAANLPVHSLCYITYHRGGLFTFLPFQHDTGSPQEKRMKRKMIWIPKTGKIETITIEDSLESIKEKIDCHLITMFSVGESKKNPNISYDFICDDEGMFVGENMEDGNINVFSILPYRMRIFQQPLFGNILMCATDENTGEYADVFDVTEAKHILRELYML